MILGSKKLTINHSGFTLVELITVMLLVSLLAGLVGPLTINAIERAQAKAEVLNVNNLINKLSYQAYIQQSNIVISFYEKQLTINDSLQEKTKSYQYIMFKNTPVIHINQNGFIWPASIKYSIQEKENELILNDKLVTLVNDG